MKRVNCFGINMELNESYYTIRIIRAPWDLKKYAFRMDKILNWEGRFVAPADFYDWETYLII